MRARSTANSGSMLARYCTTLQLHSRHCANSVSRLSGSNTLGRGNKRYQAFSSDDELLVLSFNSSNACAAVDAAIDAASVAINIRRANSAPSIAGCAGLWGLWGEASPPTLEAMYPDSKALNTDYMAWRPDYQQHLGIRVLSPTTSPRADRHGMLSLGSATIDKLTPFDSRRPWMHTSISELSTDKNWYYT